MLVLGIETSCDETACAIVKDGTFEVASTLATSREFHELTGGVVPEVAARKQVDFILPVISSVLEKANLTSTEIDAIAITIGPGLIGSLLVGVEAAKALALAWQKPLIPVNHLVGHIYGVYLGIDPNTIEFPVLVLIVSGGHSDLVLMHGHGDLEYLGGTVDDAAGEAFDKTARLLGLSQYLGGVKLSQKAAECKSNTIAGMLPRPKINDPDYDFSFSGLKTAVRRLIETASYPIDVVACEFETAVVDVLVTKTMRAAKEHNVKAVILGGGVAANNSLRSRLQFESDALSLPVLIPPLNLCGDTAVYIASAAYFLNKDKKLVFDPNLLSSIQADPSLDIISSGYERDDTPKN